MLSTFVHSQLLALLICLLPAPLLADAHTLQDAPPFSLSPLDLRKASETVPVRPEHAIAILMVHQHVAIDGEGRVQNTLHYIYRMDQEVAFSYWGTVGSSWTAWFESKPTVRARVIGPDGREHLLDQATLAEFSPQQKDPDVFTDRKELKAPLPNLAKGCLVEVEIRGQEIRPFSRAGMRSSFTFENSFPLESARFSLEAPKSMKVKFKCEGFPEKQLQRSTDPQSIRHSVTLGPIPAPKKREPFEPVDQEAAAVLKFTTTPSWNAVAREYAEILKGQRQQADLGAIAKAAVGNAGSRKEIIDRLLAHVQQRVRYTGLEFGEASIVPRHPEEVLTRGYGDCKDKACLLVALLEASGIQAEVALLRAGQEHDVDPDMPGLALFNHAIVYIPGAEELWIDPTVRLAPAGQLPVGDQGRYALIATPDTQGLKKTPQASAAQNLSRQTVEVLLAEEGPGRLIQVLEATGPEELYCRDGYSRVDSTKLREFLKKLAGQKYQAADLGAVELRDPDDLGQPFRLSFEALKTGMATTSSREAVVYMNPWPLVDPFNSLMFATPSDRPAGGADDSTSAKIREQERPEDARRTDLLIPEPHVKEARWVFRTPAGYANESLPENRTVAFGSARLRSTYSRQSDGTVEALFRFECTQRRWSPQEVMEARKALRLFGAEKKPAIHFQNTGEAHLSAGRIKEALDAFRQTLLEQPKAAAPLLRMARAQLAGGLGESARRSALRAIELEPTSSLAHSTLAWILQHDQAGRRAKEGWQRKEAIAAYRKAIQLDPQARAPRWNLALLLEYDERGDHYASGKDLEESIRLYQALSAEEKSEALDANLMRCLAFVGRYPEARAIAKGRLGAATWNDWYVAMTVCSLGLPEALSDASQCLQSLDTRRQAFLSAGDLLLHFRRYPEAGALLNEGAPASDQQTQTRARAEAFTKCRTGGQPPWPAKDPQSAALLFLLRLLDQQAPTQPMISHVARAQRAGWNEELAFRFGSKIANLPSFRGLPRPVIADLLQSQTRFAVEGSDAKGYLVHVEMPGHKSVFLVSAEEATYRMVALFQDEVAMARQATALAAQGDTKGASAWLDLAQETAYAGWTQDPMSPSPIHRLRTKGSVQTTGELKVAAASLLAYDNPSEATLATLREAITTTKDKVPLQALRKAYAHGALRKLNLKEAELVIGQLQVASPASYTVLQLRALLLLQMHRWEELLALSQRVLTLAPDDIGFTKFKWKALMHLGRQAEANALLELSLQKGKLSNQDYHEFVLLHLELGLTGPDTLELARRVTKNPEDQTSHTLQTLAAVLASLGRTTEARETLLLGLTLTNKSTPRTEDWYVLGMIAERLGDRMAATQCYSRVHKDPSQALWEKAFLADLAQRNLEALP